MKKYKPGIIGSGNMAFYLTQKLAGTDWAIRGIYSRNETSGKELATKGNAVFYKDMQSLAADCDLFFLCVPDDEIEAIATVIDNVDQKILIHHSGLKSVQVLTDFTAKAGVLWPIYSINKNNLPQHKKVPIILSAEHDEVKTVLKTIATLLTDVSELMPESAKSVLHLMAVMSNNFMNHLATITETVAGEYQVDFKWVLPIIAQTAATIQEEEMKNNQTGPAKRKDESTMEKHLSLLKAHPEWQKIYQAMSQSIIEFYKK